MSWDDLFSEELEPNKKLEPQEKEKKPKVRTLRKKTQKTPKNLSTKTSILTIENFWEVLIAHRDRFGINQLICLLSGKKMSQIKHLSTEKVEIKRTPATEAIIMLFRELKEGGFI